MNFRTQGFGWSTGAQLVVLRADLIAEFAATMPRSSVANRLVGLASMLVKLSQSIERREPLCKPKNDDFAVACVSHQVDADVCDGHLKAAPGTCGYNKAAVVPHAPAANRHVDVPVRVWRAQMHRQGLRSSDPGVDGTKPLLRSAQERKEQNSAILVQRNAGVLADGQAVGEVDRVQLWLFGLPNKRSLSLISMAKFTYCDNRWTAIPQGDR